MGNSAIKCDRCEGDLSTGQTYYNLPPNQKWGTLCAPCHKVWIDAGHAAFEKEVAVTQTVQLGGETFDNVQKPQHYNASGIEVIDVIEAWQLGFNDGNCVKYVARAAHKGSQMEDLQKARWYIDREILRLGGESWNPRFKKGE